MASLPLLAGYPPEIVARAQALLDEGRLGSMIAEHYPDAHAVRSNQDLFAYVQELKKRHMRTAPPLGKVAYDPRLRTVQNALGLNVTAQVAHGARVHKRRAIRIASLFRDAPAAFLRMIVVHELAHVKHAEHDRDFYRLCCHMEPEYHQLELDLRLYLTASGERA